jgi:hypothetical protein
MFRSETDAVCLQCRCRGGDLFTKIVQEGKYTEKRAVRCCRQLATALHFMHTQGVTHRDLKVWSVRRSERIACSRFRRRFFQALADFAAVFLLAAREHSADGRLSRRRHQSERKLVLPCSAVACSLLALLLLGRRFRSLQADEVAAAPNAHRLRHLGLLR